MAAPDGGWFLYERQVLLGVSGEALIWHQLEMAAQAGLTRVIIVGNLSNIERLKKLESVYPSLSFEFAVQEKPDGIAGAVYSARDLLNEEFIIVNPDDIFDIAVYKNLVKAHKDRNPVTIVTGKVVKTYFPGWLSGYGR